MGDVCSIVEAESVLRVAGRHIRQVNLFSGGWLPWLALATCLCQVAQLVATSACRAPSSVARTVPLLAAPEASFVVAAIGVVVGLGGRLFVFRPKAPGNAGNSYLLRLNGRCLLVCRFMSPSDF